MLSSDVNIYNILQKAKNNKDELISEFSLEFPSEKMAEDSNTIFVGLMDSKPYKRTHQSQDYLEMVDIIVVTKINDYVTASRVLKTVIIHILSLLRDNKELGLFDIVEIRPNYTEFGVLRNMHLIISVHSDEIFQNETEEIYNICKILGEVK